MSHYAKLAALGFRFTALAGLIYALPSLLMMARVAWQPGMNGTMQLWSLTILLLFPGIAVILFMVVPRLGAFVARGIE